MLERTIWSYWQQGEERAPGLVQLCLESWRRLNPGWRIVVLDERSLSDFAGIAGVVNLDRSDITVQKVSDLARLCLLREHGGVWTDATVFCRVPLNEWLPEYAATGFFAFANPGVDRLLSSWFLAAARDNLLLDGFHRAFTRLWHDDVYWNQNTRAGRFLLRKLDPMLSKNVPRTRFWLSWPVRKLLGIYPYYQIHYVFNRLVRNDARCRAEWAAVKPFSADLPHRLQTYDQCGAGVDVSLADIAARTTPVYKLDWRLDAANPYWSAVFDRLSSTLPLGR